MSFKNNLINRGLCFALLFVFGVVSIFGQQGAGSLRGQVVDEFGAAVVGATVIVTNGSGEKTATTNQEGVYVFNNLAPGKYAVRVAAPGFAPYENAEVSVVAGRREPLDVKLSVALENQEVVVTAERPISTDLDNNADTIVFRGSDLDALPDDPDELATALQALAGPSAGPNGGQIYIDGFTNGRMPSKESIREIRINQNPFSADNDRPGFGSRIEILTRPGTDKFRGSANLSFMDESLNSRYPFATRRAPYQVRRYGGNLSGPIISKKASFFIDIERNEDDENDVVVAQIVNPTTFAFEDYRATILTPGRRTTISPRFDYQINPTNTLVFRYNYMNREKQNDGSGEFALPSRVFDSSSSSHSIQLTETSTINARIVNETRFQYTRERSRREGDLSAPAINVRDAFNGGGSQIGLSGNNENRLELQNYTSWTLSNHSFKAGARIRNSNITDISQINFIGSFTFTSLEQYRNALRRVPGALPDQFSIAGGEPEAEVSQTDVGIFLQDDWRIRPDLTVGLGLRYENQTNINSNFNFAPRIALAWSPGGQQAKTVFRAGFGIFYDRLNENLTLQAIRFNGENQRQYTISSRTAQGLNVLSRVVFNPDGTVSNIPSIAELTRLPQTRRRIAEDLQAPYSIFAGFNVERQLPKGFTVYTFVSTIRSRHLLRLRNINAPLPGTYNYDNPSQPGVRPLGDAEGDILQYEASGVSNMNQVFFGFRNMLRRGLSIFANYGISKTKSDAEGGFGFFGGRGGIGTPANPYDFSSEYGRSTNDMRHRFFLGGSIGVPKVNLILNPLIFAGSGFPFNITTGLDTNGDRSYTERPALAANPDCSNRSRFACTAYGNFDLRPDLTGAPIIPRNYAQGPGTFTVNLRITKNFGFGDVPGRAVSATSASPQDGPSGGGSSRRSGGMSGGSRGMRSGGPGGGGMFGGGSEKRYNLSLSLQVSNLLNRTNLDNPTGNLSSRLFGISTETNSRFSFGGGRSTAGNRTVQAQLRFSF